MATLNTFVLLTATCTNKSKKGTNCCVSMATLNTFVLLTATCTNKSKKETNCCVSMATLLGQQATLLPYTYVASTVLFRLGLNNRLFYVMVLLQHCTFVLTFTILQSSQPHISWLNCGSHAVKALPCLLTTKVVTRGPGGRRGGEFLSSTSGNVQSA